MKPFSLLLILCISTFFFSCEKKESPLPLPPKGDAVNGQVTMGSNYETQVFYSFTDGIVLQNASKDWDIAFSNNDSISELWINGYAAAFAFPTEFSDFDEVTTLPSIPVDMQLLDDPSGLPTTSALGDITQYEGKVIIIKVNGGIYKIKIVSIENNTCTIETGKIEDTIGQSTTITKDSDYNYSYFSFSKGVVLPEPPKDKWDIVFTHYQHIFRDFDNMPYNVTGVLLNPYLTTAAADSSESVSFTDYSMTQVENLNFIPSRDVIGFNWKTVDITTSNYTVNPKDIYCIKDQNGYLWKMHFIGFYSDSGEKGSPQFEYMRLE